MLLGAAGLAITYIILGAAYYMELSGTIVLIVILVAIGLYGLTLAPVTWVILSEIFPNRIRGAAMAASKYFKITIKGKIDYSEGEEWEDNYVD